jgi:serine/threonine protein phosphatase 1
VERTVIVGDIHGCYEELIELLDVARVRDEDLLVSVGDLVDRGPRPLEVVELFQSRPRSRVLMGNHERKHVREVFSYAQRITRLQLGARYAECVAWMKTLPYYYETPEIRVVHAAMVPGIPLAEQDEDVLAGTTSGEHKLGAQLASGYWHEHYRDAVPIVFGHHVVGRDALVTENHVYGIDTGACHGGRLTALSVPDFTLYAVNARADYWAIAKREWQLPVLQARPWLTMSWVDFDAEIARFRGSTQGVSHDYLAALDAWPKRCAGAPTTCSRPPAPCPRGSSPRWGPRGSRPLRGRAWWVRCCSRRAPAGSIRWRCIGRARRPARRSRSPAISASRSTIRRRTGKPIGRRDRASWVFSTVPSGAWVTSSRRWPSRS